MEIGKARLDPVVLITLLSLPLLGLALLLSAPALDLEWHHDPSHFWLVLVAASLNMALAYATGGTARRNHDARVFLVSMAFLAAAGFLGLHALATPGVLLEGPNSGFTVATPVGLLIAAAFAAASSASLDGERGRRVIARSRLIEAGLIGLLAIWGVASVTQTTPFNDPTNLERGSAPVLVLAIAGVALYSLAVVRYLGLYRNRPSTLLLGMIVGFVLLAEAMAAIAVGRNWHASWWEWHLLMLAAFALIAWSAHSQWHEERFADLYVDPGGEEPLEISVLFADLAGFTSFSEGHDPREVSRMLEKQFDVAIPPVVRSWGGRIDRIVGDALMVTFNSGGDQPDHPRRAASAALGIQRATGQVADANPGWPRFRVGVNTGPAAVSLLGTSGGRTRTVIGDVVNVAARIERNAPVGGVALTAATAERLSGAETQPLGPIAVKGREQTVDVLLLLGIDR